ncbi:MAG: ABC transporter substrate-binding protein [Holosporaceae bacterium]|jgi:putative ABC transport system substrate-binding protein|nr:ABC transporter substrate-binding protein [Holosporaceae bacterium]
MNRKIFAAIAAVCGITGIAHFTHIDKSGDLPLVAIANYGPHASLDASLRGAKAELADNGFIEGKTVRYEIADVGFDPTLISQMITKLRASKPKVMIVKSTPVAQFAKGKVQDIPLVYCDIMDPVAAGLLKDNMHSNKNVTGSSDQEDFEPFLTFVKTILPHAKTVGLLYSTSESNDAAIVRMITAAAMKVGLAVLAVPIDQSRDIPMRMQEFRGKADFLYVGTSGPIQPALPIIAAEAQKMAIPVFNAEEQAVRDGLALASFGVNYESVGRNAGKLVARLLKGDSINDLPPIFPKTEDHRCFVNKKLAEKFGIQIPENATVVEGEK